MYAPSKVVAITVNANSAHSARFGVASETLSHTSEGTARQTISNRSPIRANNPNIVCSCACSFSLVDQLIEMSYAAFSARLGLFQ